MTSSSIKPFFFIVLCLATSSALAQTTVPTIKCADPADGRSNPIYVAGSSAVRPFLSVVAPLVKAEGYTLVYQSQGSCPGVEAILSQDPAKRVIKDIAASGGRAANYAIVFDANGNARECALEVEGNTVDVGVSDVFPATCGIALPTSASDYEGPIQPMTFIVSSASTQQAISAEAAYLAFGVNGNKGGLKPWSDPAFYFVRNASSGTQQLVARSINVPAEKWWGADRGGTTGVRNGMKSLLDAAGAEKGLGIVSVDVADDERGNLRILAFKPFGGQCAYLPDSTATSFDKKNVRDGHYPIWGPLHFITKTTGGVPSNQAGTLVTRFAAKKLEKSLLEAIIAKHLVPKCAMQVKRTTESGPYTPRGATDYRCDCFFDALTTGTNSCTACTKDTDCSATKPTCNYGFCESGS